MAGLYDFDVEAQVLDDLARKWDDPDQAPAGPAGSLLALTPATVTITAQTVGTTFGTASVALTPASVVVAAQVLAPTAAVSLSSSPASVPVAGQALGISLGAIADPPTLAVSMAGSTATLTWSASPTGGVSTYDVFYRTPSTLAVFTPGTDTALTTGTTSPYVHSSLASGSHDWQVFGVVAAAFDASDWGTVRSEFDFSDTSKITQSGGAVSQVDQSSGTWGISVVQATGSNQPTTGTRTQNGLNVLDFDGSGDNLGGASDPTDQAQPLTLVMVAASDNVDNGNRQAWGNYSDPEATIFVNGDTYSLYCGSVASSGVTETSAARVFVAIFNGASSAFWIDGTTHAVNPGTNARKSLRFGSGNGSFHWNGWIGHAIVYAGAVADPAGLSAALNSKWAVY